jgi:hypothetical protein
MDAKHLRHVMPKNAQDLAAAKELVALGPDELAPVVPEMLRHLKHHESPVSAEFCAFFAAHGERYAERVVAVLSRATMPEVKHAILASVLPSWSRDGVAGCAGVLLMLATNPDAHNNDLLSIQLLARHRLADAKWLRQWIEFKLARLGERTQLAQQVADEIP